MTEHDESVPVEAPPSRVLSALAMKAQVATALFGEEAAPVTVGRYEILETLGVGGMGVVYAAWDESLGRRVALKLLPTEQVGSERERARLAREAQALAKLSHPNVVHVYEVGEHDHGVFVAMELVEGVSLQKWQQQGTRTRRELVDVYLQAGRGVAAAHRAGLVHRDFKPANVLVGEDGRVRVVDFGLAQGPGLVAATTSAAGRRLSAPPVSPVTRTGALAGTPAYMAPEQLAGSEADARADQFSFCVALYEALVGCRPFEVAALRMASERKVPPPTMGARRLPLLLRRALRRGLAIEPPRRWPDMDELLRAVEADAAWRRRFWGVPGPVMLGLGVAWLAGRGGSEAIDPASVERVCEAPDHGPAVEWSARKQGIAAAITSIDKRFADDVWRLVVEPRLDWHAKQWSDAHVQSCRDDSGEPERPPAAACLDRQAVRFSAVLAELERVDGESIAHANAVIDTLAPVEVCLGREAEPGAMPFPTVPIEILQALERARTREAAGRDSDAEKELERLAKRPELTDALLRAEVLVLHGTVLARLTHFDSAKRVLVEAQALAGNDERGARAILAQVELATELERFQSVEDLSQQLEAQVEQLGRPPDLSADALDAEGRALVATDPNVAEKRHREALVVRTNASMSEDGHEVVQTKLLLANALADSGDTANARAQYEEVLAVRRRTLGERHPDCADVLFNLGLLAFHADELQAAQPWFESALDIETEALGPDSTQTARSEVMLATTAFALGERERGLMLAKHAWDVQRSKLPRGHSDRIGALRAVATIELDLDHHEESLALHRLLAEEAGTDDAPDVLHNIAWLQCQVGECLESRRFVDQARVQVEALLLGEQPEQVEILRLYILHTSALVALAEGEPEKARVLLAEVLREAPKYPDTEKLIEASTMDMRQAQRRR
jgi:eukaryotic-like serine/threonine-protein kinase